MGGELRGRRGGREGGVWEGSVAELVAFRAAVRVAGCGGMGGKGAMVKGRAEGMGLERSGVVRGNWE